MPKRLALLSPREIVALDEIALGWTAAESANRLRRSEGTVKTQRQDVLRTLGAPNAANAVALGFSLGLLHPGLSYRNSPESDIFEAILVGRQAWIRGEGLANE